VLRRNIELEARLIDDLLDLTRIVRGKLDLRPSVIDVHTVVDSALQICQSDMSAKGQRFTQSLEAANPYVRGDAVRLQQILWNLIRNAVKFTPDGGQIMLRSYNRDDQLHISVSDTGMGIDAASIDKIFSPFEQAGRLITQKFGGLGLGLAISKRLAEMHGGSISAHSRGRDQGATFILSLPSVAVPLAGAVHQRQPEDAARKKLNILLVEDHEDTRQSMTRLLARRHSVHGVENVAAALNAVREKKFDLVISDLGLPDGSGLELMRQLRDQFSLSGICLSGFGMEQDISRSLEAGFQHHLTKPIDLLKLEAVIDSMMK
jgi:CheY-like chemotaxis protein